MRSRNKPLPINLKEIEDDIQILTSIYPVGLNKSAIADYYGMTALETNTAVKQIFKVSDKWESFNDVFVNKAGKESSRHIVFWPKGKRKDKFFDVKISKQRYFMLKLMWENSVNSKGIFTKDMLENMKCFEDVRYFKDIWQQLIDNKEIKSNSNVESWSDIVGADFEVVRRKENINADNLFDDEFEEYREAFR